MADDDIDNSFLARLNALKKSPISLDQVSSATSSRQPNLDDDLAARFQGMKIDRNILTASTSALDFETDDITSEDGRTIEELLEDLGPDDQWTLSPDDPKDIQKVINEAHATMSEYKKSEKHLEQTTEDAPSSSNPTSEAKDLSQENQAESISPTEDSKGNLKSEDDEAAIYLQQILDELEVEKSDFAETGNTIEASEISLPSKPENQSSTPPLTSTFNLPSAPTFLPSPATAIDEEGLTELPSTPSALPSGPSLPSG